VIAHLQQQLPGGKEKGQFGVSYWVLKDNRSRSL
jgi:hypothetical protein